MRVSPPMVRKLMVLYIGHILAGPSSLSFRAPHVILPAIPGS